MRSFLIVVFLVLLIGGAGAGYYFYQRASSSQDGATKTEKAASAPVSPASSAPQYPVPAAPAQVEAASGPASSAAVPALDESDPTLQEQLASVFGANRSWKLLLLADVIRRVVVTTDNTTGRQFSPELLPLKAPAGKFVVSGSEDHLVIDPNGYARYAPYIELAEAMDLKKLIPIYVRFYPLFQSAYAEVGGKGYFNDRLVGALDSLLKAPDPQEPVALLPGSVSYKYADTQLEALPAGQKLLIRMGASNRARLKQVLNRVKKRVTHLMINEDPS